MENASKALILAGAILIAIVIVSLGVLIFNTFGSKAKDMANMDEQQIQAFNNKIRPYLGNAVKGTQVNALLQYCLSVNMTAKKNGETERCITIKDQNGNTLLNGNSTSFTRVQVGTKTYKVEGEYVNGLLKKLKITL